jgi:hypothetical protein
MRSQCTPGATSSVSPAPGGTGKGYSSVLAMICPLNAAFLQGRVARVGKI